jgi:2-polyprenyl-3-methyl-5-hydroxy-6-metoxy-1,4-benzoquinol methylase
MKEEGAFFDLILILDVIEHVEDYFSFLRDLKSKSQYKLIHRFCFFLFARTWLCVF